MVLSQVVEIFSSYVFKYDLSLFSFWDPYDVNVSAQCHLRGLLNYPNFFSFFFFFFLLSLHYLYYSIFQLPDLFLSII